MTAQEYLHVALQRLANTAHPEVAFDTVTLAVGMLAIAEGLESVATSITTLAETYAKGSVVRIDEDTP